MSKLRPDIQLIADENPELARLLEFKATFLWSDWKLFRALDTSRLAKQINDRAEYSVWFTFGMTLFYFLFLGAESIRFFLDGFPVVGSMYSGISVLSIVAAVGAYRRRDRVNLRLAELGYSIPSKAPFKRLIDAQARKNIESYIDNNEELRSLADQDSEMTALLMLSRYFKYGDHQLLREGKKKELATRLQGRITSVYRWGIAFLLLGTAFTTFATWRKFAHSERMGSESFLLLAMLAFGWFGMKRFRTEKSSLRPILESRDANQS